MAVRGTPDEIAKRWAARTSAATGETIAGIRRVTEAPGVAAARQEQAWVQNTMAAQQKWKESVQRTSLQEWQQATEAGASRIAAGVNAKQGKMARHMAEFIPHLEQVQRELQAMPRGDINQNLARMIHNAKRNSEFRRTR